MEHTPWNEHYSKGCHSAVEVLLLSARGRRAEHGGFSLPNGGGFAGEEPTPLLGDDWEGQKRPTVGRRKNLQ